MESRSPEFGAAERANARALIALALAEDLDAAGDVTSLATIPPQARGEAGLIARASGVLCGLPILELMAEHFDVQVVEKPPVAPHDGQSVEQGRVVRLIAGQMRSILAYERIALNFLQRLSGIATHTSRFVAAVAGTRAAILDTRKTTPGWRVLEKYAVRCGGGRNHRSGLFDAILIKDNHLAFLANEPDPIGAAVARARRAAHQLVVEVEVASLEQLDRALACLPDIILLDNMSLADMSEAVRRRDQTGSVLLEASGGVSLATVRAIAETGVDRISVGALTHSAPALDLALDVVAL